MIAVQNIIDGDKTLFTIVFDRHVLKHLKCKADDYLVVLQSHFKPSYLMIAKSDTGYRIRRFTGRKHYYQVNISFKFSFIPECDFTQCIYFLKKNNTIRLSVKI